MRRLAQTLILIYGPFALAATTFDTSVLSRSPNVKKQTKVVLEINGSEKKETSDARAVDLKIQSYATLQETARSPKEKAEFSAALAGLRIQKARIQSEDPKANKEEVTQLFALASKDAETAMNTKGVGENLVSYSRYLAALGFAGSGNKTRAAAEFEKLLKTSPEAPFIPGVVLYLAEHYSDNDKYPKAVQILQKHIPTLPAAEKGMAIYKLAWAYAGMQELDEAEAQYITLVNSPDMGVASKNAVKELAYVATQNRNESGVVALAEKLFKNDSARKAEFLSSAWSNLQRVDRDAKRSPVFTELMKMASDSQKRIQLWLSDIQSHHQSYASIRQYVSMNSIRQEFLSMTGQQWATTKNAMGSDVLIELEELIRSYTDTYAKREENKENISGAKMVEVLRNLFEFHTGSFPEAKNREVVFNLWMDVCSEAKAWDCVNATAQTILADATLKNIHQDARIDRIHALDSLYRADKPKWSQPLIEALEQYTANDKAPEWMTFTKLLCDLYVQTEKYDKAIALLTKLNTMEPSENSFHRLQMARYMSGQYQEVIQATPPEGVEKSAATNELVREAALKLATQSRNSNGKIQDFESNVDRFLSLNKDSDKEIVVLGDYVKKMIELNQPEKAAQKLQAMPAQKRGSAKMAPLTALVVQKYIRMGDFNSARVLVPSAKESKSLAYERVLLDAAQGEEVSTNDLNSLDTGKRNYVLRLLALLRPDAVVANLPTLKLDAEGRKLGLLALQVQQGKKDPKLTAQQAKLLKQNVALSPAEVLAAKIRFPEPGTSGDKSAKILNVAVKQVREVRRMVPGSLKGRTPEKQREILNTAASLEEKVAITLERTPVPKGLTAEIKKVYLDGLAKSAHEFRDQAADFRKAIAAADKANGGSVRSNRAPASINSWPWPTTPLRKQLFGFIRAKQPIAALIIIDLKRAANEVSEADYFAFHAGTLLAQPDAARVLQAYAHQELKVAGQTRLLEAWTWNF